MICLFPQDIHQDSAYLDCCDHYFHFDCIFKWTKVSSTCPLCVRNVSRIIYKRIPYEVTPVIQNDDDDSQQEHSRTRVVLTPEERRRQQTIRKQYRLLNEGQALLRQSREDEEQNLKRQIQVERDEAIRIALEDYRRFKGEIPMPVKVGVKRSVFVRELEEEMANEKADQTSSYNTSKALPKRLKPRKAGCLDTSQESDLLEDLDALLRGNRSVNINDVVARVSEMAYSTDIGYIQQLLDKGLLNRILRLLSESNARCELSHKETLLRALNCIPVQRCHIPGDFRIIAEFVQSARDKGASIDIQEKKIAAIAANILREWSATKTRI
jgi:hypothetical protein